MNYVRKGESMKDCLRYDGQLKMGPGVFHQSFKMKGHTHKNSGMNLEHEYKNRQSQSSNMMDDEMPKSSDNITKNNFSAIQQQFSTERADGTLN
mmetsp:Transcript_6413/g.10377  ORF Transcript_6413/g.10377 Transcript_6413/m.10377 type:complete len:94 (+) Transcript_6413:313-594(+)